jgi:hypothetical protein
MITTSGKHTVTFFSENTQGFPEAMQSGHDEAQELKFAPHA